jgi:hypothetical protein
MYDRAGRSPTAKGMTGAMKQPPHMRQIGKAIAGVLDPLTAKRANVDLSLSLAWQEIAGEKLAGRTQPHKIVWPHRHGTDDPFRPGTLIVACEGSLALDLQYRTTELLERINRFFGFHAVERIKIEQRVIVRFREKRERVTPVLKPDQASALDDALAGIEDDGLRNALQKLGVNVLGQKPGRPGSA